MRISPEAHEQIMATAARLGHTADEVVCGLLDALTVRVPLTAVQHDRWTTAARELGIHLDQFVRLHVEASLAHGNSAALVQQTLFHVQALTAFHGCDVKAPERGTV